MCIVRVVLSGNKLHQRWNYWLSNSIRRQKSQGTSARIHLAIEDIGAIEVIIIVVVVVVDIRICFLSSSGKIESCS